MGLENYEKNRKEDGDFYSKSIKQNKCESIELCFWNEYQEFRS